MRNYKSYVPILRSKKAEFDALLDLRKSNISTSSITPLFEIVPASFFKKDEKTKQLIARQPEQVLVGITNNLISHWGTTAPIFVDSWHIEESIKLKNNHPLAFLGKKARCWGLELVPVTGIDDKRSERHRRAVKELIQMDGRGVCVRLLVNEVYNTNFSEKLERLIKNLEIEPSEVDLLIDYQVLVESAPSLSSLCNNIPKLNNWRSFIVASGACFQYPSAETVINKFDPYEWERKDWLFWKDQVIGPRPLNRIPSYSDYTIQYGIYEELPPGIIPGAKIIYTCDNYWIVMWGNQLKGKDAFEQYLAFAQLLCERQEYSGKDFCPGDEYIFTMSQEMFKTDEENKTTGNAKTWIQAGINRHMAVVISQIANLS